VYNGSNALPAGSILRTQQVALLPHMAQLMSPSHAVWGF
jgi:hypothetical protein